MSDAINILITNLENERYSLGNQNIRATVNHFVAALEEIQGGLTPSGVQSANTVYAGPVSGAAALPVFRALVAADLPTTVLQSITTTLTADVALNNTANYFDGPSVPQGNIGSWFASGSVTLGDTFVGQSAFFVKLWDGVTVIDSGVFVQSIANNQGTISLSGDIVNPAGNIRISVRDVSHTTGAILFNLSGNAKDSTLSAIRIA